MSDFSQRVVQPASHLLTSSFTVFFQVKIQGQNKEMLATACQMFMGKSEGEIAQIALETLEGHQRAIIAHLTVEVGALTLLIGLA